MNVMKAAVDAAYERGRREALKWQPIESYPYGAEWASAYTVLLCHDEKRWIRFGKYYPEAKRWYYSGTSERSQWAETAGDAPTHWQAIPELPPEDNE